MIFFQFYLQFKNEAFALELVFQRKNEVLKANIFNLFILMSIYIFELINPRTILQGIQGKIKIKKKNYKNVFGRIFVGEFFKKQFNNIFCF